MRNLSTLCDKRQPTTVWGRDGRRQFDDPIQDDTPNGRKDVAQRNGRPPSMYTLHMSCSLVTVTVGARTRMTGRSSTRCPPSPPLVYLPEAKMPGR